MLALPITIYELHYAARTAYVRCIITVLIVPCWCYLCCTHSRTPYLTAATPSRSTAHPSSLVAPQAAALERAATATAGEARPREAGTAPAGPGRHVAADQRGGGTTWRDVGVSRQVS